MKDTLRAIRDVVGDKGWIDDPAELEPYLTETRGLFKGRCEAVVRPASTEEAARVVTLCAKARIPITPQGGNTSHVGGSMPDGGIVLCTTRMNRIRAVDALNHTITVEAGCVLANVQQAAAEVDCLFPLSMASEGTSQIGGNLASNAGGINVLRYGNARELVMGVEVVLPDGQVWNGLRALRKDNTGYDLKNLFIGAEGTLGIITAAVLKLYPLPHARATAMAAVPDADALLDLFARVRAVADDRLTGFEMIPRLAMEFVIRHIPDTVEPFREPFPYYALVELTSPQAGENLNEPLERVLGEAMEAGSVIDAAIAASEAQADNLWRIRENIHLAQRSEGGSIKHDIAVPVSRIPEFMTRAVAMVETAIPGVRVCAFGHVGDGNIHFNLSQPTGADKQAFLARWHEINGMVNDLLAEIGGTISAEHGIGQLKAGQLAAFKSPVEMDLMRRIKHAIDPEGVMNPGKVLI